MCVVCMCLHVQMCVGMCVGVHRGLKSGINQFTEGIPELSTLSSFLWVLYRS